MSENQAQVQVEQPTPPSTTLNPIRRQPGVCPKCNKHIGRGLRYHMFECLKVGVQPPKTEVQGGATVLAGSLPVKELEGSRATCPKCGVDISHRMRGHVQNCTATPKVAEVLPVPVVVASTPKRSRPPRLQAST